MNQANIIEPIDEFSPLEQRLFDALQKLLRVQAAKRDAEFRLNVCRLEQAALRQELVDLKPHIAVEEWLRSVTWPVTLTADEQHARDHVIHQVDLPALQVIERQCRKRVRHCKARVAAAELAIEQLKQ